MASLLVLGQAFKAYAIYIFIVTVTIRLLWNKFGHGINNIPGPTLAGFSRFWRLNDVRKGQAHKTAIELHQKYGNLVRIGPKVVSVGDPTMIPIIYNMKGDFKKSAFYPLQCISWMKRAQHNLFSTRDERYHREHMKKVASAYTMTSILEMEADINSCVRLFIERLSPYAERDETVDLGKWLQYYTFDVVGECSFNKKFGFLEKGGDVDGMIDALDGMLVYASLCGQVPEAHKALLGNPLFPYVMPQMETWNEVLNFTLKAINSTTALRRDGELEADEADVGKDMLSRWASVKRIDPLKMTTRDVVVHLSANVFAGSGTTAIALRAVIYFLCKKPSTMKKLVAEIDAAKHGFSNPVAYKEAARLPYLNAVLKEAMRLHPSAGLILERHVPAGGAIICGEKIPAGTIVGINAWVVHRDTKLFPDPEEFIPERWIESSPEMLLEMDRAFFSFGAGSRYCIGKNMSMMEMIKVIAELLVQFDVKLTYPEKEWTVRNYWFVSQKGLDCKLSKR